jgi:hypothetical protein
MYYGTNEVLGSKGGLVTGNPEGPNYYHAGSPTMVAWFTDFMGDALPSELQATEGDTGHAVVSTSQSNGVARIDLSGTVTAATSAYASVNMGQRNVALGSPTNGEHRMTARLRVDNFNDTGRRVSVFVGFADTGIGMPAFDTGAGVQANDTGASAAGVFMGSRADTGWVATAINGGTVMGTTALTKTAVTANKYYDVEVVMKSSTSDTGGYAHMSVGGSSASIANPVAPGKRMTFGVWAFSEDTGGSQDIEIDVLSYLGTRDTGE